MKSKIEGTIFNLINAYAIASNLPEGNPNEAKLKASEMAMYVNSLVDLFNSQSQPEENNFVHTVGTPVLESTTTCSQDTTEEKINWQDEEDKIRRYKLGDKVRLKKTLIPDKDYDGCSISPRNYSYFKDCDCIVDIHIVDTNPVQYSLLAERRGRMNTCNKIKEYVESESGKSGRKEILKYIKLLEEENGKQE